MNTILKLKEQTRSLKDKRKNLKYKLNIILGNVSPECSYGCSYYANIKDLAPFDLKYTEPCRLSLEIWSIEEDLKMFGKVILKLRGGKWKI